MADEWVELRVHGVHATPPESMLDIDRVRQVGGDQLGRFFRPADRWGAVFPRNGAQVLEGYHWGRLTSGSFLTGLWLLLAPFGLVNAAQFMLQRPKPGPARWAHAVAGAMLRLVGLALTALFVYTATVMTLDLWAWQRAAASSGLTYVLALLGPVALIVVFQVLARTRPEVATDRPAPPPPAPSGDYESELTRPGFFEGDPDAPALRGLHVAAGLAVVAAAGMSTAADGPAWLRWAVIVLIALVTVGTVLMGDPEGSARVDLAGTPFPDRRSLRQRLTTGYASAMRLVGWAAVVAVCAVVWRFPPATATAGTHPPGIDRIGAWVMSAAVAGVFFLIIANGVLAVIARSASTRTGDDRPFRPYGSGMACTLVALLGVFLGIGYSGALTTLVARLLDPSGTVAVPGLFARVVYAWGITALVMTAVVIYAVLRRAGSLPVLDSRAERDYGGDRSLRIPRRWVRRVASAMWTARLKNHAVCVLSVSGALGVLLTVPVVWQLAPTLLGRPQAGLPEPLPPLLTITPGLTPAPLQVFLVSVGTLTLSAIATTLVALGRTAVLGESARRGVNVIWDVISFWPRSVHPFVPAAYSQRAVADIEDRLRWHLTDRDDRAVALCGHSQGSLLCFAALVRIAAADGPTGKSLLDRIAFLTFGSQLQVMFSRAFPAYLNRTAITSLFATVDGRWRNLYRDTDPLAGPVLSWDHHRPDPRWVRLAGQDRLPYRRREAREEFGPDWRLVDPPPPADADLQTEPLLAVRGHSDFWLDSAWYDAIDEVIGSFGLTADRTAAPQFPPKLSGVEGTFDP